MIGSLQNRWQFTWREVWVKLAHPMDAPVDFFILLFDCAMDFLVEPPIRGDYEVIHNDPAKARSAFRNLKGTTFKSEAHIVRFLEAAHTTIADLRNERLKERFERLIIDFLARYNLRYRVAKPFKLRSLLSSSFAGLYAELEKLNIANPHLAELMDNFEHSFDSYIRSHQQVDLKASIRAASMYTEGLATVVLQSPGTLGALCDHLNCWPHCAVRDSLKRLYGFCSDYPGIRHSGNPDAQLRGLDGRDVVLLSVLLFSFSGYFPANLNLSELGV
jgi:hypothetical protein